MFTLGHKICSYEVYYEARLFLKTKTYFQGTNIHNDSQVNSKQPQRHINSQSRTETNVCHVTC